MSNKRLQLSVDHYNSLVESRDWCHKNGLEGMKRWYDEEIEFHRSRRALPGCAPEAQRVDDEDDRAPRRKDYR